MDRILVDECLSVALVATAKARGHDATHVVWLGKEGMQDCNLMPLIVQNDFVFVTNNRRDFLKLYAEVELHSGLVIILPSVDRDEQVRLFNYALDAAEELGDLVNKVIEVDRDGSTKVSNWAKGKSAQ
jgi:predicted nuclease of predicted toxin-antitoxin system